MLKVQGYYAVRRGRIPGIYPTWDDCQKQTKGFKSSRYKRFDSQHEAEVFMHQRDPWETSDTAVPQPLKDYDSVQPPELAGTPQPLSVGPTTNVKQVSFQLNPASALAVSDAQKRKQHPNDDSDDEVEIVLVSAKKLRTHDGVIQVYEDTASGSAGHTTGTKKSRKRRRKNQKASASRSSEASTTNGTESSDDPLKVFFARRNYANPIAFQHLSEAGFTVHELRSMQGLETDVISKRFHTIFDGKLTAVIESLAFVVSTSSAAAWTELEASV